MELSAHLEDLEAAIERIRFAVQLRLNYSGLNWGDVEADAVAAILATGATPQLARLDLYQNAIGDTGAQALATALATGATPQLATTLLTTATRNATLRAIETESTDACEVSSTARAASALPTHGTRSVPRGGRTPPSALHTRASHVNRWRQVLMIDRSDMLALDDDTLDKIRRNVRPRTHAPASRTC